MRNVRTVYPRKILDIVEEKVPLEILEAMRFQGWNVLGIYELVKEELKAYESKIKPPARQTGNKIAETARKTQEAYKEICMED